MSIIIYLFFIAILSSPGTGLMQFSIREKRETTYTIYDQGSNYNIALYIAPDVASHIVLSLTICLKNAENCISLAKVGCSYQ